MPTAQAVGDEGEGGVFGGQADVARPPMTGQLLFAEHCFDLLYDLGAADDLSAGDPLHPNSYMPASTRLT
ncbi:MAG: hypothetical protein R2856_16875 [Caldilineaceae bacterium]